VEIFPAQREFAIRKACAEVVDMAWESFGRNVHERRRKTFSQPRRAFIRKYARKSTGQRTWQYRPGVHAAMFSTNPQHSSQQQESIFYFLKYRFCESCCACEKERFRKRPQTFLLSSPAAISTACRASLAFILCQKRSTVR
jgi:hypothetical protein